MSTVTLRYGDTVKTVSAEPGTGIYQILSENGVPFAAPCGGNGRCGKCRVKVSGNVKADADGTCLACRTVIDGDCEITLIESEARVLTGGRTKVYPTDGENKLFLAVDIGTTTIAAYLMDGKTGRELNHYSSLNPQRVHGADVISRLEFASNPESALLMKDEIEQTMRTALNAMGARSEDTPRCYVGNTVMMHIAAGYETDGLARAPFRPYYTAAHTAHLGGADVYLGGCISGYVGADTVAASLACDIDKAEDTVLLIDIGTNGEIVLKHNGHLACCSCAAGPAFEGAHIKCGSGAVEGAIDHVERNEAGEYTFTAIGTKEPVSLCGSALVDAVALLIEDELISPSGRMKEKVSISRNVYIDPSDIREVQLAKAAIAAGIEILLNDAGISAEDVDRVLIAGGFGNYIRISSACTIGMLPRAFEDKVTVVGNAAGDGAKLMCLSSEARNRAAWLRDNTCYIELSAEEDFQDIFTDMLLFEEED